MDETKITLSLIILEGTVPSLYLHCGFWMYARNIFLRHWLNKVELNCEFYLILVLHFGLVVTSFPFSIRNVYQK